MNTSFPVVFNPQLVCASCATVFTLFFFISPIEAGIKMYRAKHSCGFSATPVIMACICSGSQVYFCSVGLFRNNAPTTEWLNLGVNVFGLCLNELLLIFHYVYNKERLKVIIQNLLLSLMLLLCILIVEIGYRDDWKFDMTWWGSDPTYLEVFSLIAVGINIGMYAGPLAVARHVIKVKSSERLPLGTSAMVCAASAFWMLEGLLLGQITFWLPNSIGLILGVIQICLWAMYRRTTEQPLLDIFDMNLPESSLDSNNVINNDTGEIEVTHGVVRPQSQSA